MPKCNAAPTSTWTPITGGTASAARTDQGFEPSLFVRATVMPSDRGPRHRRRRPQGVRVRPRPAARLRRARRHLRARLRRARPPRHLGRHQPPRPRRQDPPRPRPLRTHRQPLRLVCRDPRQPRRTALADYRPRRGVYPLFSRLPHEACRPRTGHCRHLRLRRPSGRTSSKVHQPVWGRPPLLRPRILCRIRCVVLCREHTRCGARRTSAPRGPAIT
jgi:hypothetical protein